MIDYNAYNRFIEDIQTLCKNDNLAPSTIINKISALRIIYMNVPNLTRDSFLKWLENYVSERTNKKLGPHGKNRYIKAINWYLNKTQKFPNAKKIAKQLDLKCYKIPHSPGKVISIDKLESILQYAPDEVHELAFRLIYEAGFRPHELLSIRVCDIRLVTKSYTDEKEYKGIELCTISIPDKNPETPSGRNKTGGRSIIIYKNITALLQLMEKRSADGGMEARLFPYRHKHFSNVFSRMKKNYYEINSDTKPETEFKTKEASLKNKQKQKFNGRLYDLRHSAITEMYTKGLSDQVIRKMVGWRPASKMPNTYVHIGEQSIITAFLNLDQFNEKSKNKQKNELITPSFDFNAIFQNP